MYPSFLFIGKNSPKTDEAADRNIFKASASAFKVRAGHSQYIFQENKLLACCLLF